MKIKPIIKVKKSDIKKFKKEIKKLQKEQEKIFAKFLKDKKLPKEEEVKECFFDLFFNDVEFDDVLFEHYCEDLKYYNIFIV